MKTASAKSLAIAIGAALVVAVIYWTTAGRSVAGQTLDPSLFNGSAHEAYTMARDHPEVLVKLHCYCGCTEFAKHKSLLDCFKDTHASVCPVCMHEALDAAAMLKRGQGVAEMRRTLAVMYGQAAG